MGDAIFTRRFSIEQPPVVLVENWSSSLSNGLIAWILPQGQTRFAIASNVSGIWSYRIFGQTTWTNFGSTGGYVSAPVFWNGVLYNGYAHSAPWGTGNNNYEHRFVSDTGQIITSQGNNEVASRGLSIWTGTKV